MLTMVKTKFAAVMAVSILVCSIVGGCSATSDHKTVNQDVITNEDHGTTEDTDTETDAAEIQDETANKKVTEIGSDIVSLLGNKKETVMKAVAGCSDSIKVEESEGKYMVTTDLQSQRDAVLGILDSFLDEELDELKKKTDHLKISYDMQKGYLDIFCSKKDADSIQNAVNDTAGIAAFANRMANNTKSWSITVTVSDSDTGKIIQKVVLSEENSHFSIPENAWEDTDDKQ